MQFKQYKFRCARRLRLEDAVFLAALNKKCDPNQIDVHDFRERHDRRDNMWHYKLEWLI